MRYSKSDNLKAITADVKSAICILGLEFIHSNPRMQIAKNTYGGRFAVYRIADCVPMREKRPLTSKQQLAGQRLSVLSRLNSTSGRMARQAYDWLSLAPLFLDTETTGLDNTAEALEIGLTDAAGQVVFETRLKPTVAIGAQAAAVHGISEQALCGAPSWTDVARQLRHAIGDRPVIIFNARFINRN